MRAAFVIPSFCLGPTHLIGYASGLAGTETRESKGDSPQECRGMGRYAASLAMVGGARDS